MDLDAAAIIEARREYSKLLKESDDMGSVMRECDPEVVYCRRGLAAGIGSR